MTAPTDSSVLAEVRHYYSERLQAHGPTPRGVDWNSGESQRLRFEQLLSLCAGARDFSLGDYGCGYGALLDHLTELGTPCRYLGYDIAEPMIHRARERHAHRPGAQFSCEEAILRGVDFLVASGVFNVKLQTPVEAWNGYVLRTIDRFARLSCRGFAFNVLTSYSDPDRRRPDLYYADPCILFDHCKRHYARNVALLHDYGLYEFTLVVRP
jgi:SAM-dependent methyltransferase